MKPPDDDLEMSHEESGQWIQISSMLQDFPDQFELHLEIKNV